MRDPGELVLPSRVGILCSSPLLPPALARRIAMPWDDRVHNVSGYRGASFDNKESRCVTTYEARGRQASPCKYPPIRPTQAPCPL
jgi:hypothetical protein